MLLTLLNQKKRLGKLDIKDIWPIEVPNIWGKIKKLPDDCLHNENNFSLHLKIE